MSLALDVPPNQQESHETLPRLNFKLSPTQKAFCHSTARYPTLIGSEGEGKTFSGIAALFAHAVRCQPFQDKDPQTGAPYPMSCAIIRDTHIAIKRHLVKGIKRICGSHALFQDDCRKLYLPDIECDLYGMDDDAALGRMQGGEYDLIWIEEPAPILHTGNSGIRRAVYEYSMRRIRGRKTPKRLQVTMNPAATDHWTYNLFIQNPLPGMQIFRIKKGENPHLSAEDRTARAFAFRNRPDLAKRYDEGEFGAVFAGMAITPEFSELLHISHDRDTGLGRWLMPMPGIECIRLWDGGLNPSAVILQITPAGHIHFLDAVMGVNMGMRQMIRTKLKKVLARPRYERCTRWRDIGDPALNQRDQSDSDQRAAFVIEEELGTTFEPGVSNWDTRREGLKEMFSRNVDGRPMVQINPRVTEGEDSNLIIMALSGGYQYPVNAIGQVNRDGPLKNNFCVDTGTEILTRQGWKRHDALTVGESVYSYSMTRHVLTLDTLNAVHRFPGSHAMLQYHSQNIDMLVTMNHRCIVNHRWSKGIRLVEAAALCASDSLLRAASFKKQIKPWFSDAFVRLCAWIMAEGSYGSGRSGAVTISQSLTSNEPYCQDIESLVLRFAGRRISDRQNTNLSDGRMRTWLLSGEIVSAIKAVMPNKIASPDFIHRMTNVQRRLFLYEMIRADGTWEDGSCIPSPGHMARNRDFFVRATTPRIFQKDRAAIDALQMLCVLTGLRATIRAKWAALGVKRYQGWSLSITREGAWSSVNKLTKDLVMTPDGVWCPQTAEGTWIARRNGLVFITGNSHVGDAISHGMPLLLFPAKDPPRAKPRDSKAMDRTKGYAVR